MAGSSRPFSFVVLSLLVSSLFSNSDARLLVSAGSHGHGSIDEGIDIFFDGLFGGIKSRGPSPRGGGHRYTDGEMLGEIKPSGPSPGQGNHYTTSAPQNLGGMKNSGPSPGQGNSYTTKAPRTLGGIQALVRDTNIGHHHRLYLGHF